GHPAQPAAGAGGGLCGDPGQCGLSLLSEPLNNLLRSVARAPVVFALRRQDAGANIRGPEGEPRTLRVMLATVLQRFGDRISVLQSG
ncbi:MAG: hypothetical protein ACREPU_03190, partial [Rhodanobacteraceae bacterium]